MSIIDSLPYVRAGGDGGPRSRTQVVVIHVTDNTASDEAEASYAQHRADKTSAHFYVDADSIIRALPLGDVAYGCYPAGNAISVQFEFTGHDTTVTDAELRQAAPIIAEVCRIYGLPIRHLTPADVAAGVKGLCGHLDITRAFGQGDHTDGGAGFPWSKLLAYVNAAAHPVTPTPEVPTMFCVKLDSDPKVFVSDGLTRRPIDNVASFNALKTIGVKLISVPTAAALDDVAGPVVKAA